MIRRVVALVAVLALLFGTSTDAQIPGAPLQTSGGGGSGGTGTGVPGGGTGSVQINAGGSNFGGVTLGLGTILVGQASTPAAETLSQDCTLASTGVITCLKTNNVSFGTAAVKNTGTSGATIPLLNGANTFSGASTFSSTLAFSGLSAGTITTGSFLGLDGSNNVVLGAGGAGGSISVTDGTTTVTGTTTLRINGGVVSGATPNATWNPTFISKTVTSATSYTALAADMGNGVVYAATSGTPAFILPTASSTIFAPGQTLTITVPVKNEAGTSAVAVTVTNSTGLTATFNALTLLPGSQGTFVANTDGTGLDFYPGMVQPTTTTPGGVLNAGDLSIASGVATVAKIGGKAITLGTLTDGDACTYTAAGTVINCTSSISGTGTVTSITAASGITGGTVTTTGTFTLDLTHANTFSGAQSFGEVHGTAYAPALTSNNYTAAITDCGNTLRLAAGTTPTVTLPNINPGTGECAIKFVQMTSGTSLYTFQATTGATLVSANGYTHTAKQYATVVTTLIAPSTTASTWSLSGEGS